MSEPVSIFEEKPRWPGAPRICIAANLPAFDTRKALDEFMKTNGPSCKVTKIWQCEACNCLHAKTKAPDPTGSSNGGGRSSKES